METKTQMTLFPETTVVELKSFLKENYKKGCVCGACGQFVKMYDRPITSAMAYALIIFRNASTTHSGVGTFIWIHAETLLKDADCPASIRGDFSKLKYWGLIEAQDEGEGWYRMTTKGDAFVKGEVKVESHVMLYNNKFYGFKGDYVEIRECLKKKFNYDLLMKNIL